MKSIKVQLIPLLLLLVCLLLAACGDTPSDPGSGSQGQTGSSKVDPCSLLTKDQAEAVLGVTIAQPTSQQSGPTTVCNFGQAGALNFLNVSVFDQNYSKSQFEASIKTNEALIKVKATSIAGIGDEAFYADSLLNVLKGNSYLIVSLVNPALDEPAKIEKLKQAASQIVNKL